MIKMGRPGSGFAELVSSVVGTPEPDGLGVRGNGYSQTRTKDPIYSVVCASGPDGSGGPCDKDSSTWPGPDKPFHCIVCIIPQGPGGPGVSDGEVPESTVIEIPGDVLALSVGFLEIVTETLYKICLSPVNPRSELATWDELSNRFLCDVGVIAVALCPLEMMCKFDCPWLSPFMFVYLGRWFAASRGHLVLTALRRDCWEPGARDRLEY